MLSLQNVKQVGSVIKLTFNDDLNVEYHKKTGLLSVEINPFYFASTGGLLGVFDNEPAFDFVNPDGELERSVEDFARSWEVIFVVEKNNYTAFTLFMY